MNRLNLLIGSRLCDPSQLRSSLAGVNFSRAEEIELIFLALVSRLVEVRTDSREVPHSEGIHRSIGGGKAEISCHLALVSWFEK